MKLVLSFVVSFDFVPNEKNVLDHVLSLYSKNEENQFPVTKKKKWKNRAKDPRAFLQINYKLQDIFDILRSHNVTAGATAKDVSAEVESKIAASLEINDVDETFIFDETISQHKAVISYQLLGHKFQILIQYCGHLAKVYFNNSTKCVKCYIQDDKAWAVFVMKHDFGNMNEANVRNLLNNQLGFMVEYNDKLEDKKIRDNDAKYDGYFSPIRNEVDSLFSVEIEQASLFKERAPMKHKKELRFALAEQNKEFDFWDIPKNGTILSGILDSEQKIKMVQLIQTWHQEMKKHIGKVKKRDAMRETQKEIQTQERDDKATEKTESIHTGEALTSHLDLKVNGSSLLSDSTSSVWFCTSSEENHQYFGLLLKSREPLPPNLIAKLEPLSLKLGNVRNLPMEKLTNYGVTRIYAIIEFENPLTNIETTPQPLSKNVHLNFFKMIPFATIENYQRLFAAFFLKHMTIRVMGEIEKEIPVEAEEMPDMVEIPTVIEQGSVIQTQKIKKSKKRKRKNKVENEKKIEEAEALLENITAIVEPEIVEEDLHPQIKTTEEEKVKVSIPDNIIESENERSVLIRICLFRINLKSFVKFNHYHSLKETLCSSAVCDKNIPVELADQRDEVVASSLEVNYSQEEKAPSSAEMSNSKYSTRRRSYLVGVEKQTVTLEFHFQIQACFKNLCKELYTAGSNGINNIFVLFEDMSKMKQLLNDINKYNGDIRVDVEISDSPPKDISEAITGFALDFSDVGFLFVETTIERSFPSLLKLVLKVRSATKKIVYNTKLIIPDRTYTELLGKEDTNAFLFTYSTQLNFKQAVQKKWAPKEVYVNLCELSNVRSVEDIHRYQLLPDMRELNSLNVVHDVKVKGKCN